VTWSPHYLADGLDSEETIAYYMEAATEEGAAGVLDALDIVGRARLINQLAASTGIDRRRLCAALDGGPLLDDADIQKVLGCFPVPISSEAPVAVG
jgi:probable addiction module antidote protein